jgi:prepilin-type N-terminal cleavage/methylation domain-containing protein
MKKSRKKYFTLVELLMVCAIIAVLAGLGIGIYAVATRKSAEARCEATIKKICVALESYKDKTGYYIQQTTIGAFYVDQYDGADVDFNDFIDIKDSELFLFTPPAVARGALKDGFAREFRYQCPGTRNRGSFDLYSQGSDTSTTADDIKNW